MPPEFISFFAPILPYLQGFFYIAVPAFGYAWKMFWDKQRKQDEEILNAYKKIATAEKEAQQEISTLKERLVRLELTAVSKDYLNQMMKNMADDMERRISNNISDLKADIKDFIKEVVNSKK